MRKVPSISGYAVYKFIFNKISLFLYCFNLFFLILTCSCQYSYKLTFNIKLILIITGTCFIQKTYAPGGKNKLK